MIEDVKILVVGDIMLDKYVVGDVSRISPEAPVPIVNVKEEYYTLGGCGNVVRNIREIGAQVDCLASIGFDKYGAIIDDELDKLGVNSITAGSKITTVKERIISDQRQVQMIRIDREDTTPLTDGWVIKELESRLYGNKYDIIILSDYAKGMITRQLMTALKAMTETKIIIDPKPIHGYLYDGVYMITPNEKEWDTMLVSSEYNLSNVDYFLVTKGKHGMTLIERLIDHWDIHGEEVSVYNVSGAGDTVIAVMGVCISLGMKPLDAAHIANKCAGWVVTQPGTSAISKNKFMKLFTDYKNGV